MKEPSAFQAHILGGSAHPWQSNARELWADLRSRSSLDTPFSDLAFAETMHRHLGVSYRIVGVTDGSRWPLGILCFEHPSGWPTRLDVPPFTLYTSILGLDQWNEAERHAGQPALTVLLDHLTSTGAAVALHLPPEATDARPFQWAGWSASPLYTYRLNLNTWPETASSSTRRSLRKAQTAITVTEQTNGAARVARLCAQSYQRHNRSLPAPPDAVTAWIEALAKTGCVRLFTAEEQGHVVAALAVLVHRSTAYYWIAGSEPGAGMTALLGQALPALRDDGIQTFDLVGANTASIAEFKRRLGAQLTPFLRVSTTPSRLLRLKRAWPL